MAQEEIIFKVGVDTGDSASRVASIDKEFDTLRKSIKDTEQEVDKLSKEFGDNSKQADEAKKKLSNLSQSYKELSKAATDVNAKFEEVYGELQPLTTRLGEAEDRLYELALAGKQNTKEYQDLLETVARYRQTQIETDRVVDSAAQTFTQKLGGAIQAAANGYAVVQGAMGLFGTESKELEKSLLKVQSAMALAQGIEGVRTALPLFKDLANTIKTGLVGAFSSLKGAIASTGIGLLVIGIGLLISKMMDYFKTTEEIIKQNQRLLVSNNRIIAQIGKRREKLDEDLEKQLAYAEAMGKSDEDLYNIKKKFSDKSIKANNDEIQTRLDNVKKLKAIDLGVQASSKEQYLELVKANKQKIVAEWERINELKKINSKANDDVKIAQIKLNNENKEEQEKANETAKQNRQTEYKRQLDEKNQNRLKQIEIENQRIQEQEALENEYYDSLKTQQELEEQAVRDKYNKIIETTTDNETLKLARQKELDAIAQKYKDENDKQENERQNNIAQQYEDFVNEYNDVTKTSIQKEKDAVNEKYFYLISKAEEYGLDVVALKKKQDEEINALNKKQAEEEKLLRDKKIEDVKQAYTDITSSIATSQGIDLKNIQDKHAKELEYLKDNFSNKSNYADLEYGLKLRQYNEENVIVERQKKLAEIQKKIAIFQTTIDTAQSLASTIKGATAAASAGGPAAPFLLAGYIATGVATVMKSFATVKSLLNAPMPSITPPKMPRSDNQGMGDNNGNTGTQTEIQAQSTYKVVVVDSDITKMQEKTKKTELISTI